MKKIYTYTILTAILLTTLAFGSGSHGPFFWKLVQGVLSPVDSSVSVELPGPLTITGTTNDGSTNITTWKDSDGATVGSVDTDGNINMNALVCSGSEPTDVSIPIGHTKPWIDETTNQLHFKIKKSDGNIVDFILQ